MKQLFKAGTKIRVQEIHDKFNIEPKAYNLNFDHFMGYYYLEETSLNMPNEFINIYPDITNKLLTRIALKKSFSSLFSGISGSGKSVLVKKIAEITNLPIIFISDSEATRELSQLKDFIETVGPCVIIFDEYEKTFEKDEKILEFFDGIYKPNVLHYNFVIVNDTDINKYMKQRPGRLFYNFKFESLPKRFVELMVEKFLQGKRAKEVIEFFETRGFISADIIMTVCDEAILFPDISIETLAIDLNI